MNNCICKKYKHSNEESKESTQRNFTQFCVLQSKLFWYLFYAKKEVFLYAHELDTTFFFQRDVKIKNYCIASNIKQGIRNEIACETGIKLKYKIFTG